MADRQRDVIEVLEDDHREVEQMFQELESLRGAATDEANARRKDLAEQVTIELVRHSVAEEVLVYPKVERQVDAEQAEHAARSTPKPRRRSLGSRSWTPTIPRSTTSWRR
jgi:hemerythrin superfamily protein